MEFRALQVDVNAWMLKTFGDKPYAFTVEERCCRFIEEAGELLQSCDFPIEKAIAILQRTYSREKELDIGSEVGGAQFTLIALCNTLKLDLEIETQRALTKGWDNWEKIREKNLAKEFRGADPI